MDVRVRVHEALSSTGYSQLKKIQFRIDDSTITLIGVVESFYIKQLAQESIKKISGVRRVLNHLEVKSTGKSS